MDPSKKSGVRARHYANTEKCTYYQQKKEFEIQECPLKQVKTSTTTTTSQIGKLTVPVPRHRILSDTALLPPPRKKIRIACSKLEGLGRTPLGDLDKNIAHKNYPGYNTELTKNTHIVKTVRFNNESAFLYYHKKVEKFAQHKKGINAKCVYDKTTCSSQSTQLADCKAEQPTTTNNFKTSSNNKPSASNQRLARDTPDLNNAFKLDRTNITVRKELSPHLEIFASKDDSYIDEIFVDSSQHFIAFEQPEQKHAKTIFHTKNRYISPIKPNLLATKSTVIFQGIPDEVRRPAKKMTLSHKTHSRSKQGNSAYCLDIYNTEYLDDIVRIQLRNDWKYVLKINLMNIYNPRIKQNRIAVVNWLIRAQDYLNLSQTVLFTTIRLFDRVLETVSVPCNMCQLIGLVIMWIVNKFEDAINFVTASQMLALCNGVYSKKNFLQMEQKLLVFFNFDLHIPDVTIYVIFYLKKLRLESDLLLQCAFYSLECYALNVVFSTVTPSLQAASAVRLALKIFCPSCQLWQQLKDATAYYPEEELINIMEEMLRQFHLIQDPAYDYREAYLKYSTKDKVQVSTVLLQELVAIDKYKHT